MSNIVEFRGQTDGLWMYIDDQAAIDEVLAALEAKIASSNNFFSGAEVTINTGTRLLSPSEQRRIRLLVERQHAMRIRNIACSEAQIPPIPVESPPFQPPLPTPEIVRAETPETTVERDLRPEERLAPASQCVEETDEEVDDVTYEGEDADFMKMLDDTFRRPVNRARDESQLPASDDQPNNEETALYFRGTVRSGQTLEFPGNILILGDVNPGAYVVASGDIIVMGRLFGVVHAGAEGETNAMVIGVHFQPSQLRIAQYIGRSPDVYSRARQKHVQTEKAYIKDGMIVIEPIL